MADPDDRTDTWTDSVSMRLACLALDTRGRLTDDLVTARAVRGALLVDLALQDRVTQTDDAVEVDTSPTGFAPADLLLAGGATSLGDVVARGQVDQRTLADEHLRRGSWTRRPRRGLGRRRHVDSRLERTHADERLTGAPPDRPPADAALAVIAGVLGLLAAPRSHPTEEQLAGTEPARWVVELVVADVADAMSRGRAVRLADG